MKLNIYHVNKDQERAWCTFLRKMYKIKKKVLMLSENDDMRQSLNLKLWTFSQSDFVPHGTCDGNFQLSQPILLAKHYIEDYNPDVVAIHTNQNSVLDKWCTNLSNHSDFKKIQSIVCIFLKTEPISTECASLYNTIAEKINGELNCYHTEDGRSWNKVKL